MTANQLARYATTQAESRTPSTNFAAGLERAVAILDTTAEINSRTALLPREACDAVIRTIEAQGAKASRGEAIEATVRLLRNYPDFKAHDAKGYVLALQELFECYPAAVCHRVTGPEGLPGRLPFMPKTADVKQALDQEVARLARVKANAAGHNIERNARARRHDDDAYWEANKPSEEARQRMQQGFKALCAKLQAMPDPIPPRFGKADRPLGPPPYQSTLDIDALIASHDAGLAERKRA